MKNTTFRINNFLSIFFSLVILMTFAQNAFATKVILTFDVERETDGIALRKIDLDVPATYFFTGEFAEDNPEIVSQLAEDGNTIGVHSHAHKHLTELNETELRRDLLLNKLVVEKAAGKSPVWFRAPFLEYDNTVLQILKELGIKYDSSDQERWQKQNVLTELPISDSPSEGLMIGDYNIFLQAKMSEERALEFLIQEYEKRAKYGRPLVFLLHPGIISEHLETFNKFIDYVKVQGGTFLSADAYVESLKEVAPKRFGVWIDFSLGQHNPSEVVADIKKAGMTDAFLMVKDHDGLRYDNAYTEDAYKPRQNHGKFDETLKLLKKEGIKVHAWLPIARDPATVQMHPKWGMVGQQGTRSSEWLSPSHPDARKHILKVISSIIKTYDVDGIHLDYLRFPDTAHDFSEYSVEAFKASQNIVEDLTNDEILFAYHTQWMNWRMGQITSLTQAIQSEVKRVGGKDMVLSAALIAEAAKSYRSMEKFGQNYIQLADHLDMVMPMAYFKEDIRSPSWIDDILLAVRGKVGDKPILMGVSAYKKPGFWDYAIEEWSTALDIVSKGSEGIVVYPYLFLFEKGDPAYNAPANSIEYLKEVIKPGSGNLPKEVVPVSPTSLEITWKKYKDPLLKGVVGLLAVIMCIALFLKCFKKKSKPLGLVDQKPIMDWKDLEKYIAKNTISGEIFDQVMLTIRQFDYQRIEQYRLAFILDTLQSYPEPLSALLNMSFSKIPGWKMIGLRYLEEARLMGYAYVDENSAGITEEGIKELKLLRDDGYSEGLWLFIEKRLQENLLSSCHRCDAKNLSHWFWPTLKCTKCKKEILVKQCNNFSIVSADNTLGVHSRSFSHTVKI